MREETVKKVVRLVEQTFKRSGLPALAESQRVLARFLKSGKGEPESLISSGITAGCIDTFMEALRKMPELTPSELEEIESGKSELEKELRSLVRPMAIKHAKDLPNPPGGRPRALKRETKQKVCREIGDLLGQGLSLRDAQARVAVRNGTSLRTIQRAWQENRKLKSRSPAKPVLFSP